MPMHNTYHGEQITKSTFKIYIENKLLTHSTTHKKKIM